jgi:DNA-binding transcriptional ArsR family regulator
MPRVRIKPDQIFHALGDATRRAIVARLGRGPASVSQLAAPLKITVTAVGQHLQVLEACGLATTEKVGRTRTCRLETAGLSVLEQWARDQRSLWEERLDQLGGLLGGPDGPDGEE